MFAVLLGNIEQVIDIKSGIIPSNEQLQNIVKTFEFISITPEGLNVLFENIPVSVDLIALCFETNRRRAGDKNIAIQNMEILYPAATILLDLTANENLIEQVSVCMKKHNMFNYIIQDKLIHLMDPQANLNTT